MERSTPCCQLWCQCVSEYACVLITYSSDADGSFHINLCLSSSYTALRPAEGLEALNWVSMDSSQEESNVWLLVKLVAEVKATTSIEDA